MRTKGKITSWSDEKGYGFISPLFGGDPIFIHVSGFGNRSRRPELGQVLTYEISSDKQGRPCAVNALSSGNKLKQNKKKSNVNTFMLLAVIFLAAMAVFVFIGKVSPVILVVYIGLSLLTYFMYAADKSAAKKGLWRTSEKKLHLLALAGGWPGALMAQQNLRHKSKKQSFRSIFFLTILFNCVIFTWLLFSVQGKMLLNSLPLSF